MCHGYNTVTTQRTVHTWNYWRMVSALNHIGFLYPTELLAPIDSSRAEVVVFLFLVGYQRFFDSLSDEEGSVGIQSPHCTAQQPRKPRIISSQQWKPQILSLIRASFEKFVESLYYSESELCVGAVTVWFSKYLPWKATYFLPRSKNVLQTVCRKLEEDSGTGGFDLGAPFSWLEKPRNRIRRNLDWMADALMWLHRSRWAHPLPLFYLATLTLH
jgi:hypothetical protein